MIPRLEGILTRLAQEYAPYLLQNNELDPVDPAIRVRQLARALAKSGVLVLIGIVPGNLQASKDHEVKAWVEAYADLYHLLAKTLFPSLDEVDAFYADAFDPPITVVTGQAHPLIWALAGYVAPYVVARQPLATVQEGELWKMIGAMLEDLGANTLEHEALDRLRYRGGEITRHLLSMKIRFSWIPDFTYPLFTVMPMLKEQLPAVTPPPPKPDTQPLENLHIPPPELPALPLESLDVQEMPTEQLEPETGYRKPGSVPFPYERGKSNGKGSQSSVPYVPLPGIGKRRSEQRKKNKD